MSLRDVTPPDHPNEHAARPRPRHMRTPDRHTTDRLGTRRRRATDEVRAEVARLDTLAQTLDARFRLPFTGIHVGVDGLVGLIPGIGDTLAALPSAYLIVRGWQLGARKRTLTQMSANTGIDWILGTIPLVGDLFDIGFKGNLRNVRLLREDLLRSAAQ